MAGRGELGDGRATTRVGGAEGPPTPWLVRGRRAAALAAGLSAALLNTPASAAAPDLCLAAPGEPVPLPQVNDADAFRARWATLQAAELARQAEAAEPVAGATSQRLWRRVLCLDPQSAEARAGLARTASVRVHRPELVWGPPRQRPAGDPWAALAEPVVVTRAPAAPPPEPASRVKARELLEEAETSLAGARFSEALGRAQAARDALSEGPSDAAARSLGVRAEIAAATANVALGDEAAARAGFARALALDPGLSLDPVETSPKVLGVLEAARAETGAP